MLNADEDLSIRWLELRRGHLAFLQLVDLHRMAPAYFDSVQLARDALDRPHDRTALTRLLLDCSGFAEQIRLILDEDGNTDFLRDAFAAILLERARHDS